MKRLPDWLLYEESSDTLIIHGKRYAAAFFGPEGLNSQPGTVLQIISGPAEVVCLKTVDADEVLLTQLDRRYREGWRDGRDHQRAKNAQASAPDPELKAYCGVRCMCVDTGCRAGPGCPHYTKHCAAHMRHEGAKHHEQ